MSRLPEKATWYGEPDDLWWKIEETYEEHVDLVVIHRRIFLRSAVERVVLNFRISPNLAASEPA